MIVVRFLGKGNLTWQLKKRSWQRRSSLTCKPKFTVTFLSYIICLVIVHVIIIQCLNRVSTQPTNNWQNAKITDFDQTWLGRAPNASKHCEKRQY